MPACTSLSTTGYTGVEHLRSNPDGMFQPQTGKTGGHILYCQNMKAQEHEQK